MIRRASSLLAVILATFCLALAGCAKKEGVDTAGLEKNFQSAEPTLKESADKAISAIRAGDYAGAMATLQGLASQAKLTPEQQKAVSDVIAQVKEQLAKAVKEATEGGQKALDDLQKSLPK